MSSGTQSKPKRIVWHREAVHRVVHPRLPRDAVSQPVQPLMILSPASLTLTASLASDSPHVPNSLTASKALARPLPLVSLSHIPIRVPASASRGVLRQLGVG